MQRNRLTSLFNYFRSKSYTIKLWQLVILLLAILALAADYWRFK